MYNQINCCEKAVIYKALDQENLNKGENKTSKCTMNLSVVKAIN